MFYQAPRRVAIINSRRIPFCRANTAYTHQSNQDMMTATLQSLIDACGLKGAVRGRAAVYEKHSLVVVNRGGATGADILALAREVQEAVRARFGIELEPEPRII